jgi:hypothetical protein
VKYCIAYPKYSNRPMIGHETHKATIDWEPRPADGVYNSVQECKVQHMIGMGEFKEPLDERGRMQAVMCFDAFARNLKSWKVVKIKETK